MSRKFSLEVLEDEPRTTTRTSITPGRVHYLWKRVRNFAKTYIRFTRMSQDIQLYGASMQTYTKRSAAQPLREAARSVRRCCLLTPKDPVVKLWSFVMAVLLAYTAVFTPYVIAFIDEEDTTMIVLGYVVDCGFFLDICMSFMTAYYGTDGKLVTDRSAIAKQYVKGWFIIDLIACIPFQLFLNDDTEDDSDYNKLLRLFRLPRMYRLVKVFRLLKLARIFKSNDWLKRLLTKLRVNLGVLKLIKFFISVLLLVHIVGCMWFLLAKVSDFDVSTWVVRYGYIDHSEASLYVTSVYWVVTTLTTVGYGDITPYTQAERVFVLGLMAFGVGFYSYTISNLSTLIADLDMKQLILQSKLSQFKEFAKQTKMPAPLATKIKNHMRSNVEENVFSWLDQDTLMKELPASLRTSLFLHLHHTLVQKIYFLQDKSPDFIAHLATRMNKVHIAPEEYLFRIHEYPEEMAFLLSGKINLLTKTNFLFKSFSAGTYLGEGDILYNRRRKFSAQVGPNGAEVLILPRKHFLKLLDEFPRVAEEFRELACAREVHYEEILSGEVGTLKRVSSKARKPFDAKAMKNRQLWKRQSEDPDAPQSAHWDGLFQNLFRPSKFRPQPSISHNEDGSKFGLVKKALVRHPANSKWKLLQNRMRSLVGSRMMPLLGPAVMEWTNVDSPVNSDCESLAEPPSNEKAKVSLARNLRAHLTRHKLRVEMKFNLLSTAFRKVKTQEHSFNTQTDLLSSLLEEDAQQ